MQSVVTLRGVSFELPNGRKLFHNLNLSMHTGITALVGPNGVGKTTLAKLLSGELEPSSGTILRQPGITLFSQRKVPMPMSVQEFLGIEPSWSPWREKLLEGISHQSLCTTLSGGQWMRVRLAQTLDDQFLILDEPTNDLDRNGRMALFEFLQKRGGRVLLISHDRECLELCDDVIELSNQGLSKFGVGWSDYLAEKEKERSALGRALESAKRNREVAVRERHEKQDRQEKRNRQGAEIGARGGMPKILLGARKRRAQVSTAKVDVATFEKANKAVRDAHEALSDLKIDPVMFADLVGSEIPAQKLVAEAQGFNIRFQKWVYQNDLNFTWRGNIRLAIQGENGSGKSLLLKSILGTSMETRGLLRSGDLRSLYIDQQCASLEDEKTIFENVRETSTLAEGEIRNGLAKFLFMKENVFQKVKDLSGGERLRVALAKGFLGNEKPELLILDEPTNNLDLANIEFLESLVREFRSAVIVISHDEIFLKNCEVNQEFALTR